MTSDTTDATLALKGLLGIGVVKQSSSANTKTHGNSNTTKIGRDSEVVPKVEGKKNHPNGKKKKKKKKEPKSDTTTVQKSKKSKGKVESNHNQNQQGSKKGKKKAPKEMNKEQNTKNENENFAWSAFQSPPAASALPLPAFGSSFSFENKDQVPVPDPTANTEDVALRSPVVDRGEDGDECGINLNNLSTEKRTENEIKAMLNISQNQASPTITEEEKTLEQNDSNAQSSSSSSGNGTTTSTDQQSNNGVNLASLTISTSPEEKSTPSKEKPFTNDTRKLQNRPDSIDPIAMLMNAQSYGTANPTINNQYQSYNMYSHQTSPHHQMHPPHHQIVPPFLTIQVQVPMHLLPGRRMIVPGSPMTGGYAIPVIVPDGVCPGMYIPVSIPNPILRGGAALQHR